MGHIFFATLFLLTAAVPLAVLAENRGKATFYMLEPNAPVACESKVMLRDIPTLAALDKSVFDVDRPCGRCIRVQGPQGGITVRIVDRCEGCGQNGIDLSFQGFPKIAPHDLGRVNISWNWVDCESGSVVTGGATVTPPVSAPTPPSQQTPPSPQAPQEPVATGPVPQFLGRLFPFFASLGGPSMVSRAMSDAAHADGTNAPPPMDMKDVNKTSGSMVDPSQTPSEDAARTNANKIAARISGGLGTTSFTSGGSSTSVVAATGTVLLCIPLLFV